MDVLHLHTASCLPGTTTAPHSLPPSCLPRLPRLPCRARRQLYNAALICRLILTWFPNPPQAIVTPLATVVDPYLNLFRGIIPPLGGIDLSPILAFVTLDVSGREGQQGQQGHRGRG